MFIGNIEDIEGLEETKISLVGTVLKETFEPTSSASNGVQPYTNIRMRILGDPAVTVDSNSDIF